MWAHSLWDKGDSTRYPSLTHIWAPIPRYFYQIPHLSSWMSIHVIQYQLSAYPKFPQSILFLIASLGQYIATRYPASIMDEYPSASNIYSLDTSMKILKFLLYPSPLLTNEHPSQTPPFIHQEGMQKSLLHTPPELTMCIHLQFHIHSFFIYRSISVQA